MAVITGITGDISWGSGTIHAQVSTTGAKGRSFTLNINGDEHDTTEFATTGSMSYIKGLVDVSGSFEVQLATPVTGTAGSVTWSSGYVTNLTGFDLGVAWAEHDSTPLGTTDGFRTYVGGMYSWGGSYRGYYDSSTAATHVGEANSSDPSSITLLYAEAGATDMSLSGSAFSTRMGLTVSPSALNTIEYSYRGTGALTQSTPSAGNPIVPTGAITAPIAAESLVLTSSTGQTFTINAFITGLDLNCAVGELITANVSWRGSGALTIA